MKIVGFFSFLRWRAWEIHVWWCGISHKLYGRLLPSASCVAISNPVTVSSSEIGVNSAQQTEKKHLPEWSWCSTNIGGIYFTKKVNCWLQHGLEVDNFRLWLERIVFEFGSWLNGSFFRGGERGFRKHHSHPNAFANLISADFTFIVYGFNTRYRHPVSLNFLIAHSHLYSLVPKSLLFTDVHAFQYRSLHHANKRVTHMHLTASLLSAQGTRRQRSPNQARTTPAQSTTHTATPSQTTHPFSEGSTKQSASWHLKSSPKGNTYARRGEYCWEQLCSPRDFTATLSTAVSSRSGSRSFCSVGRAVCWKRFGAVPAFGVEHLEQDHLDSQLF